MESVPWFMERLKAACKFIKADEDIAGPVNENNADGTDYKPNPQSISVVKLLSDKKSEIEHALTGISVLMNTSFEAILDNRLTK